MKYLLTAVLIAALLSGCSAGATPEQRLAEAQNACASYGFSPGTDAYANCMMQLDIMMHEEDAQRRAALAQALRNWAAANQSVTCTTNATAAGGIGNSVTGHSTTTCR